MQITTGLPLTLVLLALTPAPAYAEKLFIFTRYEGQMLSCPTERHIVAGKELEFPTFSEDAVFLGDLRPGILEKSYNNLRDSLEEFNTGGRWSPLLDHVIEFEAQMKAEFQASLPNSCLSPTERMAHVEKGIALAEAERKKAGDTYKLLEEERKAHDPRPDCLDLNCSDSDEAYFHADAVTIPLTVVRGDYQSYACSLEQISVRLKGIKMRLGQKDPHETEATGRCGPESMLPPTATTPILPGAPNSDISG